MKLTVKNVTHTLASVAIAASFSAHAAEVTLTLGHVDPQEWTTSKKGLLLKSLKNLLRLNRVDVLR